MKTYVGSLMWELSYGKWKTYVGSFWDLGADLGKWKQMVL